MEDVRKLIDLIDAEAKRRMIAPASIARAATGNPRLYKRLLIRAKQTTLDAARIQKWIKDNPTSNPNTKRMGA